jgi:hypothetical protein
MNIDRGNNLDILKSCFGLNLKHKNTLAKEKIDILKNKKINLS